MKYDLLNLNAVKKDNPADGGITYFESEKDIPFKIRRVYYIFKTQEGMHRGFHAHKLNWQLLFCPMGSIEIILNDGKETESVLLDSPSKGLVLHPGLWREMIWHKNDSILCVAASEYYDPDEYIRDFDEFIDYVNRKDQ
mgnify:CR=1 FL=1